MASSGNSGSGIPCASTGNDDCGSVPELRPVPGSGSASTPSSGPFASRNTASGGFSGTRDKASGRLFGGIPAFMSTRVPSFSLIEAKSRYEFQIELPGVTKENIDLHINESRVVTIEDSATPRHLEDKDVRIHHRREEGRFSLCKHLESPINYKTVEANLKDGILYIVLHKLNCNERTRIPIKEVN
jgi:HSP20 family protein